MKKIVTVVLICAVGLGAACSRGTEEITLDKHERTVFSQGGEDGVLEKIFQVIEPRHKYAVEFGCADGIKYSNVRNLILNHGWRGLLMDGDEEAVGRAKENYAGFPDTTVRQAWVYPGNIEILLDDSGVPRDLDLLVIDIDSNDYYVWNVLHSFRPAVVLIEFNASYPPPQKMVIAFHPLNYWDGSDYFGASIQSLYALGKRKGYELLYCMQDGANLVFVDQAYFQRFGIRDNSPGRLYRPPQYGLEEGGRAPNGRGHPPYDTYEIVHEGKPIKPYDLDLIWQNVRIEKKILTDR